MCEQVVREHENHASAMPVRKALSPFIGSWRARGLRQLALGLLLACVAFAAAIGLLAIAGWFIATSALVALLGITIFSYLIPSAGVRAFALLRISARYTERVVLHRATFTWLAHLRAALFASATRLSPAALGRFRSADLMDRAMSDVDTLDQVILRVVAPTLSTALVGLGCLLVFVTQSAGLALFVGLAAVAAGIALPVITSRLGRAPALDHADARTRLRTELIEALEGSREIATYGAEDVIRARLAALAEDASRAQARMRRLTAGSGAASLLVSGVGLLGALGLALGVATTHDRAGAPAVALIALVTIGLFEGIEALPLAYQQLGAVRRAARRVNGLFGAATVETSSLSSASAPFPTHADLCLRDISYSYDASETYDQRRTVLRGVSLTIPSGTFAVLTGPSAAGKTTLLRVIARELVPRAGHVRLGETPLADIAADQFWRHVGYVAQDSHIFSGTIRENLLLARPRASENELLAALETVGLAELIAARDGGLDSALGEEGDRLSGGQRRRLCVARALLRQPDLLLLDEPTAGVDAATARHMLIALREQLPTSTILIATHDALSRTLADVVLTLGTDGSISWRDADPALPREPYAPTDL